MSSSLTSLPVKAIAYPGIIGAEEEFFNVQRRDILKNNLGGDFSSQKFSNGERAIINFITTANWKIDSENIPVHAGGRWKSVINPGPPTAIGEFMINRNTPTTTGETFVLQIHHTDIALNVFDNTLIGGPPSTSLFDKSKISLVSADGSKTAIVQVDSTSAYNTPIATYNCTVIVGIIPAITVAGDVWKIELVSTGEINTLGNDSVVGTGTEIVATPDKSGTILLVKRILDTPTIDVSTSSTVNAILPIVNQAATFNWAGSHTFTTTLPLSSIVPTIGDNLVNKTYVDSLTTPASTAILTNSDIIPTIVATKDAFVNIASATFWSLTNNTSDLSQTNGTITFISPITKKFAIDLSVTSFANEQDTRCAFRIIKNSTFVEGSYIVNYAKNSISHGEDVSSTKVVVELTNNDTISLQAAFIEDPISALTLISLESVTLCMISV